MNDNEIIELLWDRSENGLVLLQQKYGENCLQLSRNVLKNLSDAEECVNDTYLKVWNSIPPERPRSLKAYVLRITRNISLHKYNYNHAQKREVNNTLPMDELYDFLHNEGDAPEAEELRNAINGFLVELDQKSRVLFVRRYWYSDPISELAEKTGLSENNIYQKLHQIRKKLKEHLRKEGIEI